MQNEPNSPSNGVNGAAHEIDLSQMPKATLEGHMWRQEGIWLKCQSCPFEHGMFIEPGQQLYGINEDGSPKIRAIVVKD